jgi:hypothetical protein
MAQYKPFSKIAIIQSLKTSDRPTGEHLANELQPIVESLRPELRVEFIEMRTPKYFWPALERLALEAKEGAELPILHFECHGHPKGIVLADDTGISWEQLRPLFTTINTSMRGSLLIVMGACYGARVAQIVKPRERAPYWGIIGATGEVGGQELLMRFRRFYTTLIQSGDGDRALSSLMGIPGTKASFWFNTADWLFERSYADYLAQQGSQDAKIKRALEILAEVKKVNPAIQLSPDDVIRLVEATERPFFEEWHRIFSCKISILRKPAARILRLRKCYLPVKREVLRIPNGG